MKPRYQAVEQILVQKDTSDPLGLNSVIGEEPVPADTIDYNINLQTQAGVLMSDALALKTIEDLGLEKTYDFRPKFSPLGLILGLIAPKGVADPVAVPLHDAPRRRANAIKTFASHLKVKVTDGTRLISVSYSDPDPKMANAVVHHLADALIDYNYHIRFSADAQASDWLRGQLDALKKNAEESQAKVSQLQKDAGVFSTGDTDITGRVISVSVVLSRLEELNTALSTAESNRIIKEAVYRAVQSGGVDSISGLAGNIVSGASPDVVNSLTIIQTLRGQEATAKSTYAQNSAKFGQDYPAMKQLQGQIADLDRSIHEEIQRVASRAKSDYDIALQTEAKTRALYQAQKAEADAVNSKTIEYSVAKQEAEQNRTLYEDLYRRVKEAGAIEGLKSSTVVVMDPSTVPGRPKVPNVPIYLALAIIAGLFVGAALALLLDQADTRIKAVSEIELALGVHPLGVLPALALRKGSARRGDPAALSDLDDIHGLSTFTDYRSSLYMESVRALRTTILGSGNGVPPKVLQVTSSQPGEGKASLSTALAVAFAQQGHRVLLVECNLRMPELHELLGIKPTGGLAALLTDPKASNGIVTVPAVPGLFALVAGEAKPNAAELIGSEQMKALIAQWRQQYDFVVLDTPHTLALTDPIILAGLSDLVLMLVRYRFTPRQTMVHTYQAINSAAKNPPAGVIFTEVPEGSDAFYLYYGCKVAPYGAGANGGGVHA